MSDCQICGQAIINAEDATSCAACHTPYHPDCWRYQPRCAIYGCGSRAYLQPSTGAHQVIETTQREIPLPQENLLPAASTGLLALITSAILGNTLVLLFPALFSIVMALIPLALILALLVSLLTYKCGERLLQIDSEEQSVSTVHALFGLPISSSPRVRLGHDARICVKPTRSSKFDVILEPGKGAAYLEKTNGPPNPQTLKLITGSRLSSAQGSDSLATGHDVADAREIPMSVPNDPWLSDTLRRRLPAGRQQSPHPSLPGKTVSADSSGKDQPTEQGRSTDD